MNDNGKDPEFSLGANLEELQKRVKDGIFGKHHNKKQNKATEIPPFKITTLVDMLQHEPTKYLIKPILPKSTVCALNSLPGVGKSVWAFSGAVAIASGRPLWGHFHVNEPGKVLIIDEENPGSIHRSRIEKMGLNKDLSIHFLHYQGIKVDDPRWLEPLIKAIKDGGYVLVIFDALIRFHSAKENDSSEMSKVMQAFREIVKQTEATVLLIHHERKSRDGERRERSRGSGDIVGAIDCQLCLEEGEDHTDSKELFLYHGKMRMESFSPIKLNFDKNTLAITYAGNILGTHKEAINEVVELLGDHSLCFDEIKNATDIKEKNLRQILKKSLGKELILDDIPKKDPTYTGSPKKQFFKVNTTWLNVPMFPPIGGETSKRTITEKNRKEQAGNVQTLENTECGVVSKSALPHEILSKSMWQEDGKKSDVCHIEKMEKKSQKTTTIDRGVSTEIIDLDALEVEV